MGIFSKLLGKDKPEPLGLTRILICSVGPAFEDDSRRDREVYERYYPHLRTEEFASPSDLIRGIANADIVHLFCSFTPSGQFLSDPSFGAVEVLTACVNAGVKLLFVASNNASEAYVTGFRAAGMPLNLVMTLDRRGPHFARFLDDVLNRISKGKSLSTTWVEIAPQSKNNPRHITLPACIFFAGAPRAAFLP